MHDRYIGYFTNQMKSSLPNAISYIYGSPDYSSINGLVLFYTTGNTVLTTASVSGLPFYDVPCKRNIFGFHIHEGTLCSGVNSDPFLNTGNHFNPYNCPHPDHAGDMPPLFGNRGYAYCSFLSDHFTIPDIIGKTVVIHNMPDDFTTQPSGNSGTKIACGEIRSLM